MLAYLFENSLAYMGEGEHIAPKHLKKFLNAAINI